MNFQYHCRDLHDLEAKARSLALTLKGGEVVYLYGALGVGKTTLVKAIVATLGGDPAQVVSPTYTLVHTYEIPPLRILHLDLYRLTCAEEVLSLDLEPPEPCELYFIEWPQGKERFLPSPTLVLELSFLPGEERLMKGQRLREAPGLPVPYTSGQSPPRS